ncbi:MAG: hypothetical protein U1E05_19685, partial [Patescibacteria group bacterium]|nr:hypothetical protein [Patescibacteria group bacterium]
MLRYMPTTTLRLLTNCSLMLAIASHAAADDPAARFKTGDQTGQRAEAGDVAGKRILFLGNSITRHGPAAKIGWTGNWGMAASEEAKDYVHVLVHALAGRWGKSPEFQVHNVAVFERQYDTYDVATILQSHREFQSDIVIIALGENVPALESDEARTRFKGSLLRLLT